ncbi:MAG TPA: hypothetical protein VF170_08525 [Planctomycetaceae bacterium]
MRSGKCVIREARRYAEVHGLDHDEVRDDLIRRAFARNREKLPGEPDGVREAIRLHEVAREWEAAHRLAGESFDRNRSVRATARRIKDEVRKRFPGIALFATSRGGYAAEICLTVKRMPTGWSSVTDGSWSRLAGEIHEVALSYNCLRSGGIDDHRGPGFRFGVHMSPALYRAFMATAGRSETSRPVNLN